jgi:hypothetical protein
MLQWSFERIMFLDFVHHLMFIKKHNAAYQVNKGEQPRRGPADLQNSKASTMAQLGLPWVKKQ